MPFTFAQLLRAARTSPYILTTESAAYLVLCLAEYARASPRNADLQCALLDSGGGVTLSEAPSCQPMEADRSLREILELLLSSASAPPPDALRHIASGAPVSPAELQRELTAALVPLNRSAARRALARLYRRVGALGPSPAETGIEPPAGARRAEDGPPASASNDARLVESRPAAAPTSRSPVGTPVAQVISPCGGDEIEIEVGEPEWENVVWHSARNTPCQFNPGIWAGADGTPLLGSLEVRAREVAPDTTEVEPALTVPGTELARSSFDAEQVSSRSNSETLADAPVALRARVPGRELEPLAPLSAGRLEQSPSSSRENGLQPPVPQAAFPPEAVDMDTVVDAPVGCEPYFGHFNSRRSNVAALVEQFSAPGNTAEEEMRGALLRMADSESVNPGTVTPPPVAQGSRPVQVVHSHPPLVRKILLAGFATVGAVVALSSGWLRSQPPSAASPLSASQSTAEACVASIRIEVPEGALVYLNDDRPRTEQQGPLAQFQQVSCDSQPEVTVRIPNPAGIGPAHAWVRLPLPEPELRRAAAEGQPLTISPLGD